MKRRMRVGLRITAASLAAVLGFSVPASAEIRFTRGGAALKRLERGPLTAETEIPENASAAARLALAYYRNGVLENCVFDSAAGSAALSASLDVPDNSTGNMVKAFLWDASGNIRPLESSAALGHRISDFTSKAENPRQEEFTAALRCAYLLSKVSPQVFRFQLPPGAVADTLTDSRYVYRARGIRFSEAGASGLGGTLEYSLPGISEIVLLSSGGAFGEGFTVEATQKAGAYAPIETADCGAVLECDLGSFYACRFLLPADTDRVQITLKTENVSLRTLLAGIDFLEPRLQGAVRTFLGEQSAAARPSAQAAEKYRAIRREALMNSGGEAPELLDSLRPDGSWGDVTGVSHIRRCAGLAATLAKAPDAEKIAKLDRAVAYYAEKNERFSSWYFNHITTPECYAEILLLLGDRLQGETARLLETRLEEKRSWISADYTYTGSNEVEIATWMILYALYQQDTAALQTALERIAGEVLMVNKLGPEYAIRAAGPTKDEYASLPGIQTDYSGVFHESQLYSGGYCMTLTKEISVMLAEAKDLGLFDGIYLDDYIDQVLEHDRWLYYKNLIDYNVIGRNIAAVTYDAKGGLLSASPTSKNGTSMKQTSARLAQSVEYRQEEMREFSQKWSSGQNTTSYVLGNRYFYKPYYMVSQKGNYMAALRMSSDRVNSSEQVSQVNRKATYLADGCLYLYRTSEEYDDIFASWDWHKIPGTTALADKPFAEVREQDYKIPGSNSDIAGGVSDGSCGAAAMELSRDGLTAKKAWFFFENEIVCLGADISNTTEYQPITTVNQCLAAGEPMFLGSMSEGAADTLTGPGGVLHDGMAYLFPPGGKVRLETGEKTGDRYEISYNGESAKPSPPLLSTKKIFSLWLDQEGEEDYEYVILPDASKAKPERYLGENSPVRVLRNDKEVMAVEQTELNRTQYVFWQEGGCGGVEASAPCLVDIEQTEDGCSVSVAALSYRQKEVTLRLRGEFLGAGGEFQDGWTKIRLCFPQGEYAGGTVALRLTNYEE